ncbi:heme-dependent catalase, partial [Aureobasidium sp. EXF-8845]
MTEALKETVNSIWTDVKRGLSGAPPNDAYLAWNASQVQTIKSDEQEKIQQIKEIMERMQKRNFDLHRKAFRATHVKTQGIVKGKLHVHTDLPEHLRQGIFAEPGKSYDVAARYANEPYLLQRDQESGPRGLGLKIFDVTGPRLEGVDDSVNTQDFLFNNAPSIELTDIDTTLDIMSLREKYFDDPAALGSQLKMRTDLVKQHAPYMLENTNIISHAMYTQSAFRFGQYYGHMALFPIL